MISNIVLVVRDANFKVLVLSQKLQFHPFLSLNRAEVGVKQQIKNHCKVYKNSKFPKGSVYHDIQEKNEDLSLAYAACFV